MLRTTMGGAEGGGAGKADAERFTAVELARLAGVPVAELRRWAQYGLLPPVHAARQCYGFRALTRLRLLVRLRAAGWTPARLQRALAQARRVVADEDEALAGLAGGPRERQVTVRLPDGRLQQPGGQGVLDFEAGERPPAGGEVHGLRSASEWFQIGIEAEASQRLPDAIAAYERALPGAGAPAWFNLGNCRYELGDAAQAVTAFEAAVAIDPGYAAAWNNLGIALGAVQRRDAAITAFRRALELVPHYADAHYNLADVLAVVGDLPTARAHWRAYLTYDPNSRWAEQVRRRLQADGGAG